MSGKNLVLEIFWKRLSANQIAPFFKYQYLMNLLSRYVHIFHGGRPDWEEVIDIFHDVTCLPKHAQAFSYRTKIALSPILLLNNVYFLILNLFSKTTHPIWLIFDQNVFNVNRVLKFNQFCHPIILAKQRLNFKNFEYSSDTSQFSNFFQRGSM